MQTFQPGDKVVWSPQALAELALKREHDGPFTVVEIVEVPTQVHTQVGHHQWLILRLASGGKPLQAPIYGGAQKFSGVWFAPAPA